MTLLRQTDQPELMDKAPLTGDSLNQTLQFFSLTNRFFGGEKVILSKLERWSPQWPEGRPVSFLDVGTGGGDIPLSIAKWARKKGKAVLITGIEVDSGIADRARNRCESFPEIKIVSKNANDFIEEGEKFDYVTASLFLHHIYSLQRPEILRKLDNMADRGLILSDLERSIPGWLAVWTLTRFIGGPVPRHDGPLSVRRAFTRRDCEDMIRKSNLPYLKITSEPWFRLSIGGEKNV